MSSPPDTLVGGKDILSACFAFIYNTGRRYVDRES